MPKSFDKNLRIKQQAAHPLRQGAIKTRMMGRQKRPLAPNTILAVKAIGRDGWGNMQVFHHVLYSLLSVCSTPPLTVDSAEKYCYIYPHIIYIYLYIHRISCFYIRDEAACSCCKLPDTTLPLNHSTKEAFSLVRRKSITPRRAVGASSCPCQSCSFAPSQTCHPSMQKTH